MNLRKDHYRSFHPRTRANTLASAWVRRVGTRSGGGFSPSPYRRRRAAHLRAFALSRALGVRRHPVLACGLDRSRVCGHDPVRRARPARVVSPLGSPPRLRAALVHHPSALWWERSAASFRSPTGPSKQTTLVDGYLGSRNDEERSEMRYVVRIAEFSESSNL